MTVTLDGLSPLHASETEFLYDNPVGSWKLSFIVNCNNSMIREIEVNKTYELDGKRITFE